MKYKIATGNALLRAYSAAAERVARDRRLKTASTSAGFIIPDGQPCGPKSGFQVFVKIIRYDERLLKKKPLSGGLLGKP